MDAALETAQQAIASSSMPAAGFDALSPDQRRQVFFLLPESLRASLLADMDDDALQRFVRRLVPTRSPTCSASSRKHGGGPLSNNSTQTAGRRPSISLILVPKARLG